MGKIKEKLKEKIDFVLGSMKEDFTLKGLDVEKGKSTKFIRVFVDKPGGITIDECAKISEKLSVYLDVYDYIYGPYRLEVSSPGAENKEEK
jgi:ribosome maturation factor RimP